MDNFVEVSGQRFYSILGPQTWQARIEPGPYPYTTTYRTERGVVAAKRVGVSDSDGCTKHKYYINAGTEARRVAVASGALLADESKGGGQ